MAPNSTALTTKVESGSPYQLDKAQVLKASGALLKHIKSESEREESTASRRNLLKESSTSDNEGASGVHEPVWLILTTKKHVSDERRLKPGKIPLPNPLNSSPDTTVCLITCDPQRQFKDSVSHPSFPKSLSSRITRIIGISKLKARYKSFESKRQLLSEHDVFLADARVITMLPKILGKTFYKGTKKPVPVNLEPYRHIDASGKRVSQKPSDSNSKPIAPPSQVATEIEKALGCALVHLSPAVTTSIRVGLSSFTPQQVAENVAAVVDGMTNKFIPKGWRNVRAVHIKGPNTMALPIWLAEELWIEEGDVLGEEEAQDMKAVARQIGRQRPGRELAKREIEDDAEGAKRKRDEGEAKGHEGEQKKKRKVQGADLGSDSKERKEQLREYKKPANSNPKAAQAVA